jgi:hypothetical protein
MHGEPLCLCSYNGGKGESVTKETESSGRSDAVDAGTIEIDAELFAKLLVVASSAVVYRRLMADYLAEQVRLVEQGKTVQELVAENWPLFEEVTRAETRLFAALDDLDAIQRSE